MSQLIASMGKKKIIIKSTVIKFPFSQLVSIAQLPTLKRMKKGTKRQQVPLIQLALKSLYMPGLRKKGGVLGGGGGDSTQLACVI